ncbi:MAG: lipid-A-disaccharide synthase [Candidatus Omnitrophica bacterium]|nr:lipid-A-disaccharide synthase [Candidatus Omnitrophota bacterium]
MKKKKILIIAGETSGDLHAARLVRSLKAINPHLEFFGLGGKLMQEEGVDIIYDIVELAVVGFIEVVKHLATFKKILEKLLILLDVRRPDAVILIDYPGFNLRFARYVKEKNIPVIYYISPQIWAWGQHRIGEIKKCVDKMIVIFGFEEDLYKEAGVKVSFVGHPFLDIVRPEWKKEETIKHLHLRHGSVKIALLPGSREKEIRCHLPAMLKACEKIKKEMPDVEFILSRRKELGRDVYNRAVSSSTIKPHSLENRSYEIMDIADLVIVSSGSATLETAIMQKPMVIIYRTSFITWLLARNMIKIPDIGLVNVVAKKRVVPELVQFRANASNIAAESLKILKDKKTREEIKEALRKIKEKLGEKGATDRAAHLIQKFLQ